GASSAEVVSKLRSRQTSIHGVRGGPVRSSRREGGHPCHTSQMSSIQHLVAHIARLLPDTHVVAYDGSSSGSVTASTRISINSPTALVRLLRAPRGLGLARAWVAG